MKRRELLKALCALPTALTFKNKEGDTVATAVRIDDKAKYLCFVDPSAVDIEDFAQHAEGLPTGTPIIPVFNGDIDNAVRIYKVSE